MTHLKTLLCMAALTLPLLSEAKGDAEKGKASFKTFCVTCHGEKGDGDGPGAAALNPKPAKFSDSKYMSTLTDDHLVKVISEGAASVGKSAMMVSWKGVLNPQQIQDVVAYIRTLAPAAKPEAAKTKKKS